MVEGEEERRKRRKLPASCVRRLANRALLKSPHSATYILKVPQKSPTTAKRARRPRAIADGGGRRRRRRKRACSKAMRISKR